MKLHRILISQIIVALRDVFVDGRHADRVIEFHFKQHPKWGARDRRLFAESVYEVVRWRRWFWHLARLPDGEYDRADLISDARLWQLWSAYWIESGNDAPPFAECASVTPERVEQRKQEKVSDAVKVSVPDWLYDMGFAECGATWDRILGALNRPADVDLRANTLRNTAQELQTRLEAEGIIAKPVAGVPDALRLAERRNVFASQPFREGLFEVQDAGSQRIAPFLQVQPGMRVIDACAGAGGKALHLACLMKNKGRIIALDVHQWKLDELKRRGRRSGVDIVETRLIEDSKTLKRLAESADRVLLDVPCSGLGVLRRNPDAKWKLSAGEIDRLCALQADLLARYSRMTRPGGKLVYATCSILPRENEGQVAQFLQQEEGKWVLEEELRLSPEKDGCDGFYAARLARAPG